jgi:predicted transcriptional regulator
MGNRHNPSGPFDPRGPHGPRDPRGPRKPRLTRREKEIMDIIHRLGEASVKDIQDNLPSPPTDGAVRRMLNLLQTRRIVEFRHEGAMKIYRATVTSRAAGEEALRHVVETFFAGSAARTIASLFSNSDLKLSQQDKKTLTTLIEKARKKGR